MNKYLNPRNYWHSLRHRLGRNFKRSFSQTGEDLIVEFVFGALRVTRPSYIDIGAFDPFQGSNTALFYRNGSRGINIEANPRRYRRFVSTRRHDINLNIGVGPTDGHLDFYELTSPGLSTFSKDEAERLIAGGDLALAEGYPRPIPVSTIASVLERHAVGQMPDFLTIDAEGLDEAILRSIDWERHRPKVICAETMSFASGLGEGIKNKDLISFIEGQGYLAFADTYLNTIFVEKAHLLRPLSDAPPNHRVNVEADI